MLIAVCVYCGEPATCLDHIVPYLYAGKSPKRKGGKDSGRTVPACKICNSALGSKLFITWEERCQFIWKWRFNKGLPIFNISSYQVENPMNDNHKPLPITPLSKSKTRLKQICAFCGKEFLGNPGRKPRTFCTPSCMGIFQSSKIRSGIKRVLLPKYQN